MAMKELIKKEYSINLGYLLEVGGSPIDIFIPENIADKIGGKTLKANISSYPVLKDGDYFTYTFDLKLSNNICLGHYSYSLSEILCEMAKHFKKLFNRKNCETHFLDELYVESLVIDTDTLEITWVLGS